MFQVSFDTFGEVPFFQRVMDETETWQTLREEAFKIKRIEAF